MSEEKKKVSDAQMKAVAKYMKNNYDDIKVRVEKGKREKIAEYAKSIGMSTNQFIIQAINSEMDPDINRKKWRDINIRKDWIPELRLYKTEKEDTKGNVKNVYRVIIFENNGKIGDNINVYFNTLQSAKKYIATFEQFMKFFNIEWFYTFLDE